MDLKKTRERKGLTQIYVATKAGISVNAYQLIEKGNTKNPRPETLKKIKEILKNGKTD